MSKSYEHPYAKLAAEGINILSIEVDKDTKEKFVIFEFSWKDPKQDDKLHWSKSVEHSYNLSHLYYIIIENVKLAREELERGE